MRLVIDNGYKKIALNVRVEEDELPGGGTRYSTRLSDGQYRRVFKMEQRNGWIQVRPYKACNFVRAKFGCWFGIDANLIWEA